jgi:hypothetical protein
VYRRFEVWTVPAGSSDDWTFDAPAGTYVSRLEMFQSAIPRTSGASDSIAAWQQDGSTSTIAAAVSPGNLSDASYAFPLSGSKVIKLRSSLKCGAAANCAGTTSGGDYGNEEYFSGAVVHLVDPSLPTFATMSGSGWKAEPADGTDSIDYSVADTGAGVKAIRYYLDGVLQTTRAVACDFDSLMPCPASVSGSFAVDTTRLSEGLHELKLIVADGASNEETKIQAITVRRPPQPASASSGAGPVSTTNPGASGNGSPAVGDELHGGQGSWTGTGLSFAYQ